MKRRSGIIKNIFKVLTSKSLIGSIIFATALWAYTGMNLQYTSYIEIPLRVVLPSDKAADSQLPSKISVKVKGNGWHLINYTFFNTSAICMVDLNSANLSKNEYEIGRNDLLKNLKFLANVEPVDIMPESIILKTGSINNIKVPVNPQIKIGPKEGFCFAGDLLIEPPEITISGSGKILKSLTNWKTKSFIYSDVLEPFDAIILLSDSLSSQLQISHKSVEIKRDIQIAVEQSYYDIELKILNGAVPANQKLVPSILKVTIRCGAEEMLKFSPEEIYAYIEYNDLINDTTGYLIPSISVPKNIQVLNIEPRYIRHIRTVSDLSTN